MKTHACLRAVLGLFAISVIFQNCAKPIDLEAYNSSSVTTPVVGNPNGAALSILEQYPEAALEATSGFNVTLDVTPNYEEGVIYEWRKNGVLLATTTKSHAITSADRTRDEGLYIVTVIDVARGKRVTARTMRLTVKSAPTQPLAPEKPVVALAYEDDRKVAVFTTDVPAGEPRPTLQWQKKEAGTTRFDNLPGETQPTLRITGILYKNDDGDEYRVIAANTLGEMPSDGKEIEATYGDGRPELEFAAGSLNMIFGAGEATTRLQLLMQFDGNLVLYAHRQGVTMQALWASGTTGRGRTAHFLADGRLVVRNAAGAEIYSVGGTLRNNRGQAISGPGVIFKMQADGNLVIYDAQSRPVWASNTSGRI